MHVFRIQERQALSPIETAFITNYDEEALLSDDEWQTTMAKAIAEGINEYFSN